MWRLLKTKLNNFSFSKHKVEDKEKCPYMEFIEEQEKVDYEKVQTRTRGSVGNEVGDDRKGQKIRNT